VAFTADGATLAIGTNDTAARLWDIKSLRALREKAAPVACQRAGRGLNHEEWKRYIPDLPYQNTC
jgi:hypothetical protein